MKHDFKIQPYQQPFFDMLNLSDEEFKERLRQTIFVMHHRRRRNYYREVKDEMIRRGISFYEASVGADGVVLKKVG